MPTIDKPFLARLVLVLAVIVGALFGVHAYQAKRIPDALKRQAERAIANDKPDIAIRHLRQYLEFAPDDVDVQCQLADLLRTRGSTNELHFLYDHILRNDAQRDDVRREALKLALRTGRLSDAVGHAEAILKTTPTDAATWQYQAAAQAGLRHFDAAKTSYETAVKHDPKDILAWQRLAQFLLADMKRPMEAKVVVDKMVAALPNEPAAYLTRARWRLAAEAEAPLPARKSDPLLADLAKVLEAAPDHPDSLLLQAERLQAHRDIAGARAALAHGVEKHPTNGKLVRALAWLEVNRNNTAGAIGVLEDALPHAKDGLDLMVPLADLLMDTGAITKAEEILAKLERKAGSAAKMQSKYLRGRLAMKARKWPDAISLFNALRMDAINLPGLEAQAGLLLARCYEKTGDQAKAIETLKLVTAKDASNVSAHVALGQLYLTTGRNADAAKAYDLAVQSPFAPTSAISMLIRIQALQLKNSQAKPDAWAALEKQLSNYAPRFGTQAVEPTILRAELAIHRGDMKQAHLHLKRESLRRPQSTALWCKLAEVTGTLEGVAAGLAVLDEALGFVPDGSELRLARAKLYAKDPFKLRPLDNLLLGTESWNDAEQTQFLSGMIEVFDSLGEHRKDLWENLLARRPNDAELKTAFERASESTSRSEAEILHNARVEANRIETVADLLAWHTRRGEREKIDTILKRLSVDPRWAGESLQRAIAKANGGRQPAGSDDARNPGADTPRSPVLLEAARSYVELGWLADQYRKLGDEKTYVQLCNEAVMSPRANVEDWTRCAMTRDKEDRLDFVQSASKSLNHKQLAALDAAVMLNPGNGVGRTDIGDRESAEAFLSIHQARLNRTAAVSTLDTFLTQKLTPADRAWATRQLALLLAVRGEVADRERAAKLLTESTLAEAGPTLADRRTTAGALAGLHRYLDGDARKAAMKRAIDILESVVNESKSPQDAFALCGLYKAAGRTDDAVAKLNELLKADPGNLDYLLAALDVLVDARQYASARPFATRLLKLGAEDYRVVSAVAKFECLAGQPAAALALAEGYWRSADPLAGDVPAKTARTADLLADLSRLPNVARTPDGRRLADAAIARYESMLPGRAEALVKAAALLAETQPETAFARIEKLSRGVPSRIIATAAVTALQVGGGTDAQFAKTKQCLDAAKAQEPNSMPLRMVEAEYLGLIGNVNGAIAVYEAVLKDHPRSVAALNNLAWLLAAKPESAKRALELIEKAAQETGLTGELLDTRARIRLSAKQPALAVADAGEALRHDKTPLRYFHLGLAMNELKPEESAAYFREAKQRGLTDRQVHPHDVPLFKQLEKELK